ncbi:MAG: pilus assembly protein PilP [Gammaproteobacteria bacterium]
MKRVAGILVCAALLGGCGGDFTDLDAWMAEVRAKPRGAIEPIPVFKPYEFFTYSAQSLRPPFDVPLSAKEMAALAPGAEVKPDLTRPREFLERFNFEQLGMVGTLSQTGTLWALLSDGEGGVHRVKVGNYVGKDHGRIVETTETTVEVEEIVASGVGGWIRRPRTIQLTEKE